MCSGPPRPYLALPALILAAVVYFPITGNYFFTDDFLHLYQIANGDVLRFLLSPHGGHLYIVRNAVFAATFALWGTNPKPYFWIVLATHLVNVALLFAVLRSFLGSDRVACVVATLWGVCPLHEGTLGWYSVYGHALATTAVLGVLWDCGRTVGPGRPPSTLRVLIWTLVALLGSGCFGTGMGVALVLPLVLGLLRPAVYARWPARIVLGLLPALVVVIYTRLPDLYMRLYPDVQYVNHEIALARGGGLAPITTMVVHLLGGGLTALLLGFASRPDDYPGPGTFVLASLAGIGLFLTCFRAAPARRGQLLAFLLVALASYGMVAMGRAVLIASQMSLVTAGTGFPRYHYLGSAGLALIVGVLLAAAGEWYAVHAKVRDAMVGAVVLGVVALYATRAPTIDHHSTAELATGLTLAAMRGQITKAPPGAPVYIASYKFASIGGFASPEDFPGRAAVFVIFFPGDVLDGHTVRFVADDPHSLAARRRGGRIATLLVAPDEVPPVATPAPGP